jgi:hypothetical protein
MKTSPRDSRATAPADPRPKGARATGPQPLDPSLLRHVSGGTRAPTAGPKGTWSTGSSASCGPKGTW